MNLVWALLCLATEAEQREEREDDILPDSHTALKDGTRIICNPLAVILLLEVVAVAPGAVQLRAIKHVLRLCGLQRLRTLLSIDCIHSPTHPLTHSTNPNSTNSTHPQGLRRRRLLLLPRVQP